jgi:branched-chain amino acid transport system ATP-binding protein
MLSIKNLIAGYNGLKVLKGIDMHVAPGEIVALIGPNGAGKSTVIKAIFNIADVYEGKIMFNGKDITGMKTHQLMKQGISYVNQGRINFGNLTVRENLEIGADAIRDDTLVRKNLSSVYKRFPLLKERKDDLAYGLSGGQQQMLALGRALMQKPSLLLLDEPSLGLSPLLQKQVFDIIRQLRDEGISMLIVEQNAKRAIEMADRTYVLEDGNIALTGGKSIVNHEKIKSVYLGGRY